MEKTETESLLSFEPSELSFPFELNKQLSSSIRLLNKTGNHVAFKLFTTNPKIYGVRPRIGILLPGSDRDITVTMRALREAPHNMRCKDKFKIQTALVVSPGATIEDVQTMFNKEAGNVFEEYTLRVVYSEPTQSSSRVSVIENQNSNSPQVASPVLDTPDNILQTSTRKLLHVQPAKLQFPLVLNKELSSSLQLSNATDNHVAFRVNTDSPKYIVHPNTGIVLPQSKCDITVRMQPQSTVQSDIQSEDKFLIQSIISPADSTNQTTLDMFDDARSAIEEYQVQVVHISKQENNTGEMIVRGVITILLGLLSWYLMKQTLSLIWSLTMLAIMVMMKMIKRLVSDSVEDWIVKTLIYIVMHLVFRRKDNISLSS